MTRTAVVTMVGWTLAASQIGPVDRRTESWSLLVLFDVSVSMQLGPKEADALLAGAIDGLSAPLEPNQRARVGAFASQVRLPSSTSASGDVMHELRRALSGDPEWRFGPSRIWDAVDAGSLALAADPGRRVLLLVTDGRAGGNRLSREEVVANLRGRNVELWLFSVPSRGNEQLRAFAHQNGGRVFGASPGTPADLRTALRDVLIEVVAALTRDTLSTQSQGVGSIARSQQPLFRPDSRRSTGAVSGDRPVSRNSRKRSDGF